MTEIMTIEDSFLLPEKGVVVSGINLLLDCENGERIRALIGGQVRIAHAGEDGAVFEVKDVGISESLVGKKSISILLDSSDASFFTRGSRVMSHKNKDIHGQESRTRRIFRLSIYVLNRTRLNRINKDKDTQKINIT
jgi:hypothetical protein